MNRNILVLACLTLAAGASAALEFPELASPRIRVGPAEGLGPEKGVCRRDPSDVIRVGNTYYVWYTKVVDGPGIFQYPSGYSGEVWYATSADGARWKERGMCVRKGAPEDWDGHGVFTPGILAAQGKYYLFYDGVPNPMTPETPTGMGIAVSGSPDGPWEKFAGNPILKPSANPAEFDSFRVDDSCLLIRGGKYWLYYKGRQAGKSPAETKWGVAIADKPTGPYVKHATNPITNSGHEVLAWPHREGVALLIGPTGPEGNTIQYADDGLRFRIISRFEGAPKAPGGYRPDAFTGAKSGGGMPWGIGMENAADPYLVRFNCNLTPSRGGPKGKEQ